MAGPPQVGKGAPALWPSSAGQGPRVRRNRIQAAVGPRDEPHARGRGVQVKATLEYVQHSLVLLDRFASAARIHRPGSSLRGMLGVRAAQKKHAAVNPKAASPDDLRVDG